MISRHLRLIGRHPYKIGILLLLLGGLVAAGCGGGGSSNSGTGGNSHLTVTSVNPNVLIPSGGSIVLVTGSGFSSGPLTVMFGNQPALSWHVESDTQITVVAPTGRGVVDIRVQNAAGVTASSANDRCAFVAPPATGGATTTGTGSTTVGTSTGSTTGNSSTTGGTTTGSTTGTTGSTTGTVGTTGTTGTVGTTSTTTGTTGSTGSTGGGGTGGTSAPDFTVTDVNGKQIKLSSYMGHVVVIDFWSSWCGPCVSSFPHTESLAENYAGQGVVVLAVDGAEDQTAFAQFVGQNPQYKAITFAYDANNVADSLYSITAIPTQVVVDRHGYVTATVIGYSPGDNTAENAIVAALAAP